MRSAASGASWRSAAAIAGSASSSQCTSHLDTWTLADSLPFSPTLLFVHSVPVYPGTLAASSSPRDVKLERGGGQALTVTLFAHSVQVYPDTTLAVARRVVARWRALVAERKGGLLRRLLQELPEVFFEEVLNKRLDPTDRTMIAQMGRPWLAAVLASRHLRLPRGLTVRLRLREFCTSVERLAWAKAKGCSWELQGWGGFENPCAQAAEGGHLEVLRWAREHHCPWNEVTCYYAAAGGHLDVLQWARAHGCPWCPGTCELAAQNGEKEVLRWARENGCEWDEQTCAQAAAGGYRNMLQWARERDCPWDSFTCSEGGRGRAPGGVAVGAEEPLPVEWLYAQSRRSRRASGGAAVVGRARMPQRWG